MPVQTKVGQEASEGLRLLGQCTHSIKQVLLALQLCGFLPSTTDTMLYMLLLKVPCMILCLYTAFRSQQQILRAS